MKPKRLLNHFFENEKSSGLILVFATGVSLVLANSAWQTDYLKFWHIGLGGQSLVHWINDGLMSVFFLLIGLELKKELRHGELSDRKN
jgi:NhaA family Na+:H+ antiporter